jgi:hypothetical protein
MLRLEAGRGRILESAITFRDTTIGGHPVVAALTRRCSRLLDTGWYNADAAVRQGRTID